MEQSRASSCGLGAVEKGKGGGGNRSSAMDMRMSTSVDKEQCSMWTNL